MFSGQDRSDFGKKCVATQGAGISKVPMRFLCKPTNFIAEKSVSASFRRFLLFWQISLDFDIYLGAFVTVFFSYFQIFVCCESFFFTF